jgi:hypothetical protein
MRWLSIGQIYYQNKMSYITLADMGSSGGLCSQLQIYAALKAVAKANNKKIVFSQKMMDGGIIRRQYINEDIKTPIRVFELLDIEYEIVPDELFANFQDKHINFHTTTYDKTLFSLDPSTNYNLVGRFDLYTYWYNDIGDEVGAWTYKQQLQEQADIRMKGIKEFFGNNKPTVSLHVRRGDYLLPGFSFCELDTDYYERAIIENFLPIEDYNFVVFSNDIEYVKDMIGGDNIWFVEPVGGEKVCTDSEKEDLALLSLCDHHITANSSYSWWGAYLSKNKDKKVICPTNWLKANHQSSWINGNYYPPTWINIDNAN